MLEGRRGPRYIRSIPSEELGIDVGRIGIEDLEDIAGIVTKRLEKDVMNILGRGEDYNIIVSLSKEEGGIVAYVDIELQTYELPTPSLLALIDKKIDEALNLVRDELIKRFKSSSK